MFRRCCFHRPTIHKQQNSRRAISGERQSIFYRNEYSGRDKRESPRRREPRATEGRFEPDLQHLLKVTLEDRPMAGYRDLQSVTWTPKSRQFTLQVGHTPLTPKAPPTKCRLVIPADVSRFPARFALRHSRIRRMAAADFLWRHVFHQCNLMGAHVPLNAKATYSRQWTGVQGGDVHIMPPTQHVLEQSAVQIDAEGNIICQLTVHIPVKGRRVVGAPAYYVFDRVFSQIVQKCFLASTLPSLDAMQQHIDAIDDQAWLQAQLDEAGLVAFVADGAVLPRRSRTDDRPMPQAVPFASPPTLRVSFTLPRTGRVVTGLGIRKGITLICGGGFCGKSTLLETIQAGVYLKVPGDGRDFCVTSRNAVKIRAEEGRWVSSVDISSFIQQVQKCKSTTCFSSEDASGSTSQASNIAEAIELGADAFLLDEDTCAADFMTRDAKLMQMVSSDDEPITPFVRVVKSLKADHNISTIVVGSGDFFSVADQVLLVHGAAYSCKDATTRAREIVRDAKRSEADSWPIQPAVVAPVRPRCLHASLLSLHGKVKVPADRIVAYGDTPIDLRRTEQIVSHSQIQGIVRALHYLSQRDDQMLPIRSRLDVLEQRLDQSGLLLDEVLAPEQFHGGLMRPRLLEVGAALNRLQRLHCIEPA